MGVDETGSSGQHAQELAAGERFAFGDNWARFLGTIDAARIDEARASLTTMLDADSLAGRSFLDAGCGSGLFSLAAHLMGARVHSLDYDPQCVACAKELRRRHCPDTQRWRVEQDSVLSTDLGDRLGSFDVVYCWGVLHHTGNMWSALANLMPTVAGGGLLYVALYNDQGAASRRWLVVKRLYNSLPRALKPLLVAAALVRLWGPTIVRDSLRLRPLASWRGYARGGRGMNPWRDAVDWVGGYPFEVAKPEQVLDACRPQDFELIRMRTSAGGLGCNEFVFRKRAEDQTAAPGRDHPAPGSAPRAAKRSP